MPESSMTRTFEKGMSSFARTSWDAPRVNVGNPSLTDSRPRDGAVEATAGTTALGANKHSGAA
eukprot:CAMPEP_0170583728 /NCGR_PEP_ID=MMETSP0224-20130122/8296_1 /TAXON_ID=285029 /ORGANISM="Togula jolla, Strain CCCM 725" /LENGTH=62 /DNA_ID=CAMNT_0010907087 /DNA_START=741 /DNA_END=929 /DNA_ORIENTATION=-